MKKISIIVPIYFNQFNIAPFYSALRSTIFKNKKFVYEIIFVDDGSQDDSLLELKKIRLKDKRIKIIKLSRNFGSHVAILAGLSMCGGDCATMISADLQDPPDLILKMAEKWQLGNKVVLAVRADRQESIIQKGISNTYYRLMKKYALKNMPQGGFDCFLIDRNVVNVLKEVKEKNSTLMGQIVWSGFKTGIVKYIRRKRTIGKSRWTLSKKVKLFIDSFLAFSYLPIRLISTTGFIFSIVGLAYAAYVFIEHFQNKIDVSGWASLMIVVLIASGVQMLILGIIGEYLWRNFDESRQRPIYIIEEKIGFNDKA